MQISVAKTGVCFSFFISLCKMQLYMHTNKKVVVKEKTYS